jgi:hypothetical protein
MNPIAPISDLARRNQLNCLNKTGRTYSWQYTSITKTFFTPHQEDDEDYMKCNIGIKGDSGSKVIVETVQSKITVEIMLLKLTIVTVWSEAIVATK